MGIHALFIAGFPQTFDHSRPWTALTEDRQYECVEMFLVMDSELFRMEKSASQTRMYPVIYKSVPLRSTLGVRYIANIV